jgi:hypothetical protein
MYLGFKSFGHKKVSLPDVEPLNSVAQSQELVSRYPQKKGEIIFLLSIQSDSCDPKHNMEVTLRLVEERSGRVFGDKGNCFVIRTFKSWGYPLGIKRGKRIQGIVSG